MLKEVSTQQSKRLVSGWHSHYRWRQSKFRLGVAAIIAHESRIYADMSMLSLRGQRSANSQFFFQNGSQITPKIIPTIMPTKVRPICHWLKPWLFSNLVVRVSMPGWTFGSKGLHTPRRKPIEKFSKSFNSFLGGRYVHRRTNIRHREE